MTVASGRTRSLLQSGSALPQVLLPRELAIALDQRPAKKWRGPETTSTTTYYAYDKSRRMTTQYSSAEAHYFAFNQRNMVAQIQDVKASSPDSMRYFAHDAMGERALAIDNGTSCFTYDGTKMLTDKVVQLDQHGGATVTMTRPSWVPHQL